ncbi:O-antigen ligase family protein [Roseomonas aeriglobus]|nr:O-antigen ligase family protein [Roseomonas aeriglobus]
MRRFPNLPDKYRPDPSFTMLAIFLCILWVAGGASRADVMGQAIVRFGGWTVIALTVVRGDRPSFSDVQPVGYLLLAIISLPLVQLLPLPPALWEHLPGRDLFTTIDPILGQAQPWRPWSIVPGNTLNALFSLIVPVAVLILMVQMSEAQRSWIPGLLLVLIAASTILGLLQFSGAGFDNPFVNDSPWYVGGIFANRNHFALWLAIGCAIAPVWAFRDHRARRWRALVALGLVLLFSLTLLATGSRAGLLLGTVALGFALAMSWSSLKQQLRHAPRWAFPALIVAVVTSVGFLVTISISADRAISIQRVFALDAGRDLRARALPHVWSMVRAYFPAGSGMGSFEPVFRMREPFELLKPTYFNHAHDDFLELLSDGGLLAGLLMAVAMGWWAVATIRVWRGGADARLGRLGSTTILLVIIASVFDYPARVPTIMAVITIAATWLSQAQRSYPRPALPTDAQQL